MTDNDKKVAFSTGRDDWETPSSLFNELNQKYHFTLDPCATHKNAKTKKYYTQEQDGLNQSWEGERVFCNPPYSKAGKQDEWIRKCYEESLKPNTIVVALIPARTDTKRFHQYILGKAEITFIQGRLFFEIDGNPILDKNNRPQPAPFPSMICVWGGK